MARGTPRTFSLAAIAAVALLSPLAALAQAEVAVSVSLCRCDAQDQLRSFEFLPGRAQAELELAEFVSARASEQLPYLRFVSGASASAAPAAAKLRLELREQRLQRQSIVELHWLHVKPSGEERALQLDPVPLFDENAIERFSNNREGFVGYARSVLARVLNSAFAAQLHDKFARAVPIASRIGFADERVVLLVPFADLRLGMDSEIRVDFRRSSPAGTGSLELGNLSGRVAQPHIRMLQAAVQRAVFNSRAIELDRGWSAALPELLDGAALAAFVKRYEPAGEFETGGFLGELVVEP
jgi:hypothetical protein